MLVKCGTRWRQRGISIIEVITAIAILSVGIWAMVTLFPRGQDIIRRSGVRQLATQLAHEAITDYLAEPAKMPFAIVPFDPSRLPNAPMLLEPAMLQDVRRAYNFVWGEPIDDGLPLGDPNKRIGLVAVDLNGDGQADAWRALLQFLPVFVGVADINHDGQVNAQDIVWVYREVRYRFSAQDRNGDGQVNSADLQDFEFYFDPTQPDTIYLAAGVSRRTGQRVLRVTYLRQNGATPLERDSPVVRELYLVDDTVGQLTLREDARSVLEITEEFPIMPDDGAPFESDEFQFIPPGVLAFSDPMPRPRGWSPADPRLGALRVDYCIDGPAGTGHWVVEAGATFDPDPLLRQRMNLTMQTTASVLQTTIGGIPVNAAGGPIVEAVLFTAAQGQFGTPVTPAPVAPNAPPNSLPQEGLLLFPVPAGTLLKVAYRAGDDPTTPVDESWFFQVVKPPTDFQPFTQSDQRVLDAFPFERLRWFGVNNNVLQFLPVLAGLNVHVRYRTASGERLTETKPIAADGTVTLSRQPALIERAMGASLLVRLSGGSMWTQSPPKTKSDYVELLAITPLPHFVRRQP
ncbi:hypothetical protein HRbin17_00667 [bacterium HR17]|uniref:Dockerin domain-containing protein n=1 Tax=Candidatus Fervidibacter japonicus TaxID=2035412 RepID=A0A2H5XAF4_9BACT|nr:hypothetical protein HRbin17_00667 [bacterium HR17]